MIKIIKTQQSIFNLNTGSILIRTFANTSSLQNAAEPKKTNNTNLYKLRKSTGYALSKCREALEKFNGNIDEVYYFIFDDFRKYL
jgi:hypothetical protein